MNIHEGNIFADEDAPNPYQHLQQYQYQRWLLDMEIVSLRYQAASHQPILTPISEKRYSTFEFQPFEFEKPTERTANSRDSRENEPIISLESEFGQASLLTASNLLDDSLMRQEGSAVNEQVPISSKKGSGSIGKSFNTTDYIIKHCLKKMISSELRGQVEVLCEEYGVGYSSFCLYWKNILARYLPSKHIGLSKFKKMIDQTEQTAVVVCRLFLTSYLWHHYPRYVVVGSMRNKQEYLRCATKLMYISSLPHQRGNYINGARKH